MTGGRPTPPRDTKTNLYDAALAAVKEREERASEQQMARLGATGRKRRVSALGVMGVAGLVLLLIRPTWLAGPEAPPAEPPAVAAASLRLTLLRERDRVFEFVRQSGRLPATLEEAGSGLVAIDYQPTGGESFVLSARTGDSVVTLGSSDSTTTFLGASLKTIKHRGHQ